MQSFYYNFSGGGVNAQETAATCNLSQLFCSVGPLDSGILNVADTPLTRTYYKSLTPAGYSDVHYKLNYCPFTCPVPNNPTGCDNTADALYYYVYYPTNYPNYNTCPLPALILFHSGGFSECSSPDQDGLDYFCRAMASRGFVVFSVSYRVGILADRRNIPGTPPPPPSHQNDPKWQYVSAQQILGIYRAVQDARGAIRSIIKRQVNETSGDTWNDPYRIDTNYVFVGGLSAGSHIAMSAVYYPTQTMINKVFPNVSTALGGIDPDFYYAAPPAAGDDDYFNNVKGVVNLWGSMFIPRNKFTNPYSFFAGNSNNPPMISFAGVQDQVFDIHYQDIYFSKKRNDTIPLCGNNFSVNFGRETHCLLTSQYLTKQDSAGGSFYEYGIGSETIFHMLDDNGIFSELNLDCEMHHGLDNTDDPNCTACGGSYSKLNQAGCPPCGYQSNFGVNLGTISQTYDYMAGRIATFFQAIITGTTSVVINKKFVEQENKRYGCGTADNPTSFTPNTCDDDPHP